MNASCGVCGRLRRLVLTGWWYQYPTWSVPGTFSVLHYDQPDYTREPMIRSTALCSWGCANRFMADGGGKVTRPGEAQGLEIPSTQHQPTKRAAA